MVFGLGIGLAFSSGDGGAGGFFHLITHALMKGLAFLAAGALLYTLHLSRGNHKALTLDDLNGASRKYPLMAIGLSVAVLALGGIPPFAGFMSKWLILLAGAETRNAWMLAAVVFVGLNSVLSLAYYAPIVNRLFKRETSPAVEQGGKMPWLMAVPVVVLVLLTILIGVWPTSIEIFYGNAVNTLLTFYFS
jgi:formate hydrogenlyase subunit 3/multisubunit Na+/H+ antiporter MnhD subunit